MTVLEAKQRANEIAKELEVGHSRALNILAKRLGYKTWTAVLASTTINEAKQ